MSAKNELGKFVIVIGIVVGVAVGSIFLLNSLFFKSKSLAPTASGTNVTTPKPADQQQPPIADQPIPPPPQQVVKEAPTEVTEPFYTKLKDGEYVGVWNQEGTEKQISLTMSSEEVKMLLGNPNSESYEDGESRYLCYQYGSLSIYFEDGNQSISFLTYEDNDVLLTKNWLTALDKTQDSGDVDFYQSPSGYTSVKVDHIPDAKRVIVYLQNQYTTTEQAQPSNDPPQTVAVVPPQQTSESQKETSKTNANGNYSLHPGEEIIIEDFQVTNSSPYHTAKYDIDINYHFAFNNPNWVKVITNPEKKLELMPGETGTIQIKVKASKHAPKASYRYIILLKQGWQAEANKEFTVDVQ
ncbi:hypothetical protein P9578_08290 [Brevibacillus choshinensis]|uniref:hypothetical protein n=2 Tax=Brevibacillus choshinensis TaxID=54911 RepID=UPI002E22638E|nr:hypothetical protein [Brevibacillus choshinensis]MED4779890.1 hypothetical protein [Brevibacillus choshinensis]